MLKVNNKKTVSWVAKRTWQGNRKRNLLTIFAIALTTFFITVVFGIGMSYYQTLAERAIRMYGMDYDIELSEPREDQVKRIRSMKEFVEEAGLVVKCAIIDKVNEQSVSKIKLYWADKTCWEKQCIPAFEFFKGTYPEKENEMICSTQTLKAMGIKKPRVGMKLSIGYFNLNQLTLDEISSGQISGKDLLEDSNSQKEQELLQKDFILSGYYRDYTGSETGYISRAFYETTGARQTDQTQGYLKITLKNPLYTKQDIVDFQQRIKMENQQYVGANYDSTSSFLKMAAAMTGLLVMILVSGYLFIFNTLYISISKDIRYFGQLCTIGMTSVQLKGIVYRQALFHSCIGIPAGLCLGAVVSKGIIPMILSMADYSLKGIKISTSTPFIYIFTMLFAEITVWISSKKPADIVGNCSPIEAVRYTGVDNNFPKHTSMVWRNMFRDKKQTFVILASFTIALSLFLTVNVLIGENDAKRILNTITAQDIRIINDTTLEDNIPLFQTEQFAKLKKISQIKEIRTVASEKITLPYQEDILGAYYKRLYQSRYTPGNYEKDISEYRTGSQMDMFSARLIGIDDAGFQKLNESLDEKLDENDFLSGKCAVAVGFLDLSLKEAVGKEVKFFTGGKEDAVSGIKEEKSAHQIKIAAVTKENPAYFAGGYSPDIIVSQSYLKRLTGTEYIELVDIDYKEPFDKKTEQQVKAVFEVEDRVSFQSKLSRYQEMKQSEQQVKLLGGSLGVIFALLAVLNYSNMMAAKVQSRAREFACLESIGMTGKQIKGQLCREGLGYAGISIFLTLISGIPLSLLVFQNMNKYQVPYRFPWLENLILFAVITWICALIPPCIYQMTSKESIIERLRKNEN